MRIEKLRTEHGVKIQWVHFPLHPDTPLEGRSMAEFYASRNIDPEAAYARKGAAILGNVARATHGETVTQILGSGDARVPFQMFGLQQSPLTFVPADNPRGAASTLELGAGIFDAHQDQRWPLMSA